MWHLVKKLEKEVIYELKDEIVLLSLTKDKNFVEYGIPDIAEEQLSVINN
ncbi:hypothetical protein YSY43_34600 [Paenibacillus sp. YSY-4.3]